jgi:hypothetical protein
MVGSTLARPRPTERLATLHRVGEGVVAAGIEDHEPQPPGGLERLEHPIERNGLVLDVEITRQLRIRRHEVVYSVDLDAMPGKIDHRDIGISGGFGEFADDAAPEQKAGSSPVCLYESKAYSEGAFVCVQKSLILTCVADGARVSWKPVTEKEINDRCTAPTVQHLPPEPRIHRRGRHFVVARIRTLFDGSKCFLFNGRQYCE